MFWSTASRESSDVSAMPESTRRRNAVCRSSTRRILAKAAEPGATLTSFQTRLRRARPRDPNLVLNDVRAGGKDGFLRAEQGFLQKREHRALRSNLIPNEVKTGVERRSERGWMGIGGYSPRAAVVIS